jgi:hypothetical protein
MPSNEADIRNAALEEAIAIIEARLPLYTEIGQINALRECIGSIRAQKSDLAPVPEPKPFTFADPNAQREWQRQRKDG